MDAILGVGMLVFTIINFVIYHKLVRVVYFGNVFHGWVSELIGCLFVVVFEMGILIYVGPYILVIGGIVVVVAIGVKKMRDRESSENDIKESAPSSRTMTADDAAVMSEEKDFPQRSEALPVTQKEEVSSDVEKKVFCTSCGKQILISAAFCPFCGEKNKSKAD